MSPPAEATHKNMSLESLGASWAMDVAGVIKAVGSPEKQKIDDKSAIPELMPATTPKKVVSKSTPPTTPATPPRPAPPVEKLDAGKVAQNAKEKLAAAPSTGAGGCQKTAPVMSSAKTGAKGDSALKKLVTAAAVLILIALGVLLFLYQAPNSAMAGTVQTCALKLGVDIKDVGKKMTEMGENANGALAFLGKTPSKHKQDLTTSEQQGGLVQSIGLAAGAAVTSTVGYGLYWLLTQGD